MMIYQEANAKRRRSKESGYKNWEYLYNGIWYPAWDKNRKSLVDLDECVVDKRTLISRLSDLFRGRCKAFKSVSDCISTPKQEKMSHPKPVDHSGFDDFVKIMSLFRPIS